MKRRSITGPIVVIAIGCIILASNLMPHLSMWQVFGTYWPFLLIGAGVIRLLEIVFYWASDRPIPKGGMSGGAAVGIAFAIFIVWAITGPGGRAWRVGAFGPRGIEWFGEQYDYPLQASQPSQGIKRVVFDSQRGNIRVTGADSAEIRVTGTKTIRAFNKNDADAADRSTQLQLTSESGQWMIRVPEYQQTSRRRISADLEVTLPRDVSIEVRGGSGDVEISDIAGRLDITSGRADVRLNRIGGDARVDLSRSDLIKVVDLKGNLDLQGRGNDVELENIAGQVSMNGTYTGALEFKNVAKPLHFESRQTDLRVESLPGRISMDLGEFTGTNLVGPVRLVTKSRDVHIQDFTESVQVEIERGDIELQPKAQFAKIDARCHAGNIEVALPEKVKFSLDATTERGEARNDYGPSVKAESEGQSATLKGGPGGPAIKVVTQRGTIAVKKAGAVQQAETKTF